MNYFLDFEFIEGFYKPPFGKKRHFIDMISVGIVSEDDRAFYKLSSDYNYDDADEWVKENVISKAYSFEVHGDSRNNYNAKNFNKVFGTPDYVIASQIIEFCDSRIPKPVFYGYYADYDWVLFCSLFGRMIDLPKGWPMYCKDLKQMMDEKGVDSSHPDCPKQNNEHIALHDAKWNKDVYEWLIKL